MTVFYVRPGVGSDGNNGLSFATAWESISGGATLANITAGDEIRIMKSPDPVNVGTATFTNKSQSVTLSSALTKTVTLCESNWTATAPASSALQSTFRKQGSNAVQITVNSSQTGLIAYFPLGATEDFSGHDSISFWIRTGANIAANKIRIALCSDAVGAVTVDSVLIPGTIRGSRYYPITISTGGALGASIQSVALYLDSAIGGSGSTIILDDILATTAGNINLNTMISPDDGEDFWWAIRSISDTALHLEVAPDVSGATTGRGWSGADDTYDLYVRECFPIYPTGGTTPINAINDTGTAGSGSHSLPPLGPPPNYITYSGGWNDTDMSTVDGTTWFDGLSGECDGMSTNGNTYSYISIQNISHARVSYGIKTAGTGWFISQANIASENNGGIHLLGNGSNTHHVLYSDIKIVQGDHSNALNFDASVHQLVIVGQVHIRSMQGLGANLGTNNQIICCNEVVNPAGSSLLSVGNCNGDGLRLNCTVNLGTLRCFDNNGFGVRTSHGFGDISVRNIYCDDNVNQGLAITGTGNVIVSNSLHTSGNSQGITISNALSGKLVMYDFQASEGVPLSTTLQDYSNYTIYSQNEGGVAGTHIIRTDGGTIQSDTLHNHAASGLSWKLTPTKISRTSAYPLVLPLGKFAVQSGTTFTGSAWFYLDGTSDVRALLKAANTNDFSASQDVSGEISTYGAFSTESVSVVNTVDGVVEMWIEVYHVDGTVGNSDCWVSDVDATTV